MRFKYRNADSTREIQGILKATKFPGDHLLWQNLAGKRHLFDIVSISTLSEGTEVKIVLSTIPRFLDDKTPIYLKLNNDETVFKVKIIQLFDNVLVAKFPHEVKTIELRKNPRVRFKPSENKVLTLSFSVDLVQMAKSQSLFQVIDISESGVSIVCGPGKVQSIVQSPKVELTRLGHIPLLIPVELDLIYYHEFTYRRDGKMIKAYRMGFKFKTSLQSNLLDKFMASI